MINYKIDLVVPYIDNTDPAGLAIFNKNKYNTTISAQTTATERFRSQSDFFRYFFRAIDKNMPGINNIFLLVMFESQVPKWLDTTKVKIITHDMFIPNGYRPTFNSGVIELFLHKIPGLSEHFLYANDDFYAGTPTKPEDFFEGDVCKFNIIKEGRDPKIYGMWWQVCQNNSDLIYGTKHALPYNRLDHEFRPELLSKIKECYKLHQTKIKASITPFRHASNFNCYIYSLYLDKMSLRLNSNLQLGYIQSNTPDYQILTKLNTANIICINDTDSEKDIYKNVTICSKFNQQFSTKSKYELTEYIPNIEHNKEKETVKQEAYLYF